METNKSPARNYCFTAFEIDQITSLQGWDKTKYICYGIEITPTTNKTHYQGYMELISPQRMAAIKKLNKCDSLHLEVRKGTQEQAIEYCKKDGQFFEQGSKSKQGERNDILEIKKLINEGGKLKDVAEAHFESFIFMHKGIEKYIALTETERTEMSKVFIYHGLPGTGKSYYIRQKHKANPDEIYTVVLDNGNSSTWWDGYHGQKIVIFDDFYGNMKYSDLLKICDRYAYKVQFKGGCTQFKATHIYFTSNKHPSQWYKLDEDWMESAFYRRIHELIHFEKVGNKIVPTKETLYKPSDEILEYAEVQEEIIV